MNAKNISRQLADGGAILRVFQFDAVVLVGHWEWLDEHRVFYFEAGNASEFGGHVLTFSKAVVPHNLGVEFRDAAGEPVGYLTTIDEAVSDIAANYRQTWKTWLHIRHELTGFIQKTKHQIAG